MKSQEEKKSNGWIVATVAMVGLIVILGALMSRFPAAIRTTTQTTAAGTNVSVQAQPVNAPTDLPPGSVVAKAEQETGQVAPETEAALNHFGLSATSVVKIVVVAQARPPVIIPNPLNRKTQ